MTKKDLKEDQPQTVTADQAEMRLTDAMVLIGMAQEEFRDRMSSGDIPGTRDLVDMGKELGAAWQALQKERDRLADEQRKRGQLAEGDIDFAAAKLAIRQQLDRIAASLNEG